MGIQVCFSIIILCHLFQIADTLPAVSSSSSSAADRASHQNGTNIPTITVDIQRRAEVRLSPLLAGMSPPDSAGSNSSSRGSRRRDEEANKACPKCSKAELEEWKKRQREEEERVRIEIIKARILASLGLHEAPNATFAYALPDDFADVINEEFDGGTHDGRGGSRYHTDDGMQADAPAPDGRRHHYYQQDHDGTLDTSETSHIQTIIVYGTRVSPCQSVEPSVCISIPLTRGMLNVDQLDSAQLKVFVRVNTTSASSSAGKTKIASPAKQIHEVAMYVAHVTEGKGRGHSNDTRTVYRAAHFVGTQGEVSTDGDQLIMYDITRVLAERLRHALRHRVHHVTPGRRGSSSSSAAEQLALQFQCTTCVAGQQVFDVITEGGHAPYVVIKVGRQRRRYRRHVVDCNDKSTGCCRDQLYIDFAKIGWSHWILQPSGYNANYCRGDCHNLMLPTTRHQSLIAQHGFHSNQVPRFKSCCAATRYSPLSLLYYDSTDGSIMERRLENLQVESCGCTS